MAITIAITRKSESATLQINNGNVVNWLPESWYVSPGDSGHTIETFELWFKGTDSTIRAAVETLAALRTEAEQFLSDPMRTESVWFSIADSVAATTRRALIYSIEFSPLNVGNTSQALGSTGILYTTVAIDRAEAWENATLTQMTPDTKSTFGGVFNPDYGSFAHGSMGGRIDELKINVGTFYTINNPINKLWVGCQPYYGTITHGSIVAYFNPIIEAEVDGAPALGSFVTGTAYSGGTCLQLGTVPGTLSEVLDFNLGYQGVADMYRGKWLVLGRAKVNSGIVGLQLDWGRQHLYTPSIASYQRNEMVYVSGTNFDLFELGFVTWPSTNFTDNEVNNTLLFERLRLNIQQISGTTTIFQFDNYLLIPASHYLKASDLAFSSDSVGYKAYTDAAGRTVAINHNTYPPTQYVDWVWPKEGGYFVVAAAGNGSHQLAGALGTCTMSTWYTPQYKSHIP